jgi:hypothetical protein
MRRNRAENVKIGFSFEINKQQVGVGGSMLFAFAIIQVAAPTDVILNDFYWPKR